jgi:RsbT co-antagonist protein rsbRD N-terminal domain
VADEVGALCAAMRGSIDEITLGWVSRVKADPYLRSDDPLTLSQLVDHVPQMLEELCRLIGAGGEPDFEQVRAASTHGYARSLAGYSLTELLRELELLRECVFDFVARAETERGVGRAETVRALRLVNRYFGEDTIFVVEHYLKRNARPPAGNS